MKIRQSFVTNSSSSSFVIDKYNLSPSQIKKIKNHIHISKKQFNEYNFYNNENNEWHITDLGRQIKGYASMDNFDMEKFLELIGVDAKDVKWSEY